MMNEPLASQSARALLPISIFGLVFMSLQLLTVFATLTIDWTTPMQELVQAGNLLTFDLEILRTSCLFPIDPVADFAARMLVIAAFIIMFCLAHAILHRFDPEFFTTGARRNSIGLIFMTSGRSPQNEACISMLFRSVSHVCSFAAECRFYISLVRATVSPFECRG